MATLYQQYYTKSYEIVTYMINKLGIKPNSSILEPCAGDGVFIEALLQYGENIKIDAFELDPKEAGKLKDNFASYTNVSIKNDDTLLHEEFISGHFSNKYDFIIANPPYGAWQDYEKREKLKSIYPNLYIKETYSTFLFLCLSLLKEAGRLVFITPDTYLNLHMHTYLRKFILQNTLVEEISIFPSSFFPGVNFGYSKLSVITLIKSNNNISIVNNKIKIIDRFKDPIELIEPNNNTRITLVNQKDILKNENHAFIYSDDEYLDKLLKYASTRIGDIANCVTGIYTGDDRKFIKVSNHSIKNSKKYEIISSDELYNENINPDLIGFNNNPSFVPIIKGGNTRYKKKDFWYINWSKEAVSFYKANKKSRFQNSQYYFKYGIAVPMVSSHSVTAALINYRIFDQSIVGVFPRDDNMVLFLLAFFNTQICTKLLRMINPSANNSANYIKKLPIIIPDYNTIIHINKLVEIILSVKEQNGDSLFIENELDNIFNSIFYANQEKNISFGQQKELFAL
jgi:phospholipid N-methyltransferase